MTEHIFTNYSDAADALRIKDLKQSLYDDGEVIMDQVLVCLHGEEHKKRRKLENKIFTRDIFRDVFLKHEGNLKSPEDYINHSLYFETKTFLHGLLVVEDKMSMAFGLETRVPFLDNDLVDFAVKCPVNLKLKNLNKIPRINENDIGGKKNKFFKSHNDGKQILRTMLRKYIPNRITEARKKGFMGLGQPLKSFRDNPFNPIKYMNKEYLNSLGDLEKNKS